MSAHWSVRMARGLLGLVFLIACARKEATAVAPARVPPEASTRALGPAASTAQLLDSGSTANDTDVVVVPPPTPLTLPRPRAPTREEELAMRAAFLPIAESLRGDRVDPSSVRTALAMYLAPKDHAPTIVSVLLMGNGGAEGDDCPVVLYHPTSHRAEQVDAPVAAAIPGCRTPRLLFNEDLNGDGIPDFVFAAKLPSNRYDVLESESRTYLSTRVTNDAGFTYCFAPALDGIALELDSRVSHDFRAAVAREHKRRGDRVFACWMHQGDAGEGAFTLSPSVP